MNVNLERTQPRPQSPQNVQTPEHRQTAQINSICVRSLLSIRTAYRRYAAGFPGVTLDVTTAGMRCSLTWAHLV